MTSNDDSEDIPGRYCIDYKCAKGHTWRSFTGKSGKKKKNKKKCNKCNETLWAEGFPTCRPLKKGVRCQSAQNISFILSQDIPENYRFWGKFTCPECSNEWYSGNAWKGYGQICKKCSSDENTKDTPALSDENTEDTLKPVVTWTLSFLQKRGNPGDQAHETALCSKCDEVGDCRRLRNGPR